VMRDRTAEHCSYTAAAAAATACPTCVSRRCITVDSTVVLCSHHKPQSTSVADLISADLIGPVHCGYDQSRRTRILSSDETRKLSSIDDRGQTDRVRVGVRVRIDLDL